MGGWCPLDADKGELLSLPLVGRNYIIFFGACKNVSLFRLEPLLMLMALLLEEER